MRQRCQDPTAEPPPATPDPTHGEPSGGWKGATQYRKQGEKVGKGLTIGRCAEVAAHAYGRIRGELDSGERFPVLRSQSLPQTLLRHRGQNDGAVVILPMAAASSLVGERTHSLALLSDGGGTSGSRCSRHGGRASRRVVACGWCEV